MRVSPKYRNQKTEYDGILFDSKLEAKRWQGLCLLERSGQISGLERQVVFPIEINGVKICKYIADFVYFENGNRVIEDAKGYSTPEFKLKAKLMKAIHDADILLSDGLPALQRRTKAAKAKRRLNIGRQSQSR